MEGERQLHCSLKRHIKLASGSFDSSTRGELRLERPSKFDVGGTLCYIIMATERPEAGPMPVRGPSSSSDSFWSASSSHSMFLF